LLLEHRQSGRARIIYLQADLEVLKARLSRPEAPDRPSLTGGTNAAAELHEIATVREPLYERLADITIQVSGRSPSDVVQAALDQLARPGMRPG
jgi:shikimate kinase